MKKILLFLIKIYTAAISPSFLPRCRFTPSCSQYAKEAIEFYGPYKGILLSMKRLSKCHPKHRPGYDPIK